MGTGSLGGGEAVALDGVTLGAPGLDGDLSVERGAGRTRRGGDEMPRQLSRAMRRQRMRTRTTIRIDRPRDTGGRRDKGAAPPPMTLTVKAPRPGRGQVVLSWDEHGIVTWHFAKEPTRGETLGPPGTVTYEIRRVSAAVATAAATDRRGFPGLSKIIQVITFPIAKVVGKLVQFKVRDWDVEHHPPQIRGYGKDGSLRALDDGAWKKLSAGRGLLFIHGTFDTTSGAFGRLPAATRTTLFERYQGRVIAFDHPTLADDPIENARTFLGMVGDRTLDLDIVCHSRGGLVTRAIAERPENLHDLAPNLKVATAVLAGATSNGTILADADNWNELVDRITTLLSFLPVPFAVDALETVFGLVRSIAVETAHDLKGLDAMVPGGAFLERLNKTTAVPPWLRYRALVSDFEPRDPGLKAWLDDEVRDHIFDAPNDMMVSIDSMTGKGLKGAFPVTITSAFGPTDAVEHADYFHQERTSKALLDWLTG